MILQEDKGMRFGTINVREESNGKSGKENSVGIIWQAIRAKGGNQIPLLWNAYPYHLFEKSGKDSKRKPNAVELQVGKKYLEELIDILGIPQNCIYAIGRTAEKQLGYMKVAYIRHPSYGGKMIV